jgi:hypothetical protein
VGIVGAHPESGVRVDLVRPTEGGPPWHYEGEATTAHERLSVKADVSAAGEICVELAADAAAGLADRVRLFVRSAWKHAQEDGLPPPRRIVRWRQQED